MFIYTDAHTAPTHGKIVAFQRLELFDDRVALIISWSVTSCFESGNGSSGIEILLLALTLCQCPTFGIGMFILTQVFLKPTSEMSYPFAKVVIGSAQTNSNNFLRVKITLSIDVIS